MLSCKNRVHKLLTYKEWKTGLFMEDMEEFGEVVNRGDRALSVLWKMYKSHHNLYKICADSYSAFT